jgi:aspartate racemase
MVQPKGPYFFGGFCFGGMVSFEMAQQLKKQGEKVALLFLLDTPFPENGKSSSPFILSSSSKPTSITLFRDKVLRHLQNVAPLGPREKMIYVLTRFNEKVRDETGRIRARVSKILKKSRWNVYLAIRHSLPLSLRSPYILNIYHQAQQNYVPEVYAGRAIYIKGEKSSSRHGLEWSRIIAGGLELYEMPGDHVSIIKEPNVGAWADKLKLCLQSVQAKSLSATLYLSLIEDCWKYG